MIIAQTLKRPQLVALTKAFLLESEPNIVATAHYKSTADRYKQTSHHHAVVQHEDDKHKHVWEDEVQLLNKYAVYRDQCFGTLIKFKSM